VTVSARPNYTWKAKTSAKHLIRNYGRGAKVIFTTVGGTFAPRCSDYRGGVHPAIFWINIHSKKPPKQHNTTMTTVVRKNSVEREFIHVTCYLAAPYLLDFKAGASLANDRAK
jgi:hypothetical protein